MSWDGGRITPNYSTEESAVLHRYVEALRSGKYDTAYEAGRDCYQDLERLWRAHPNEKWAVARRTFKAVTHQLHVRAQATGRRAFGAAWTAEESALLDRYARALAQNHFRLAHQAASACLEEMNRRRLKHPDVYAPRLPGRVSHVLAVRARELGWVPAQTRLSPEENRALDRYARGFLAGEFPTVQAAAERCMRELTVVYRSRPTLHAKTLATVWSYLNRRVHRQGVPLLQKRVSSAEETILSQYRDALMRGRYAKVTEAAADCFKELQRLWKRQPGSRWDRLQRNRRAVCARLGARARAAGRVAYLSAWTAAELRVLERFARAVVRGHYCDAGRAAKACRDELARLHASNPQSFGPRTLVAVRSMLAPLARKLGWSGAHSQLHPVEERLLKRYADAVIRGGFTSATQAASACRGELDSLRKRIPMLRPKTLSTLLTYIQRRICGLGIRRHASDWTPSEDRVVLPYARALVEGRYRAATQAAAACLAEPRRSDGPAGALSLRSVDSVAHRIDKLTHELGVPRPNGRWTVWETRIVGRFAQAVVTRRYAGPTPAFGPCFSALNRGYARLRTATPTPLRSVGGRTKAAVYRQLDLAVRELGWHGPTWPRWTVEENRICQGWVRWYGNHRRGSRGPITPAAEGLQEELEQIGARRSVPACKHHVRQQYLRQHGLT